MAKYLIKSDTILGIILHNMIEKGINEISCSTLIDSTDKINSTLSKNSDYYTSLSFYDIKSFVEIYPYFATLINDETALTPDCRPSTPERLFRYFYMGIDDDKLKKAQQAVSEVLFNYNINIAIDTDKHLDNQPKEGVQTLHVNLGNILTKSKRFGIEQSTINNMAIITDNKTGKTTEVSLPVADDVIKALSELFGTDL